jgi:hypothetical protein
MSFHQGRSAAEKYASDVLAHGQDFFMMDAGGALGAQTRHARAIAIAHSTSYKALARRQPTLRR